MQITITDPSVAAVLDTNKMASQIIANLNRTLLSPLERYAIANQLKAAAELAANILSDDAIKYALRPYDKNDPEPNVYYDDAKNGKEFMHRGCYYQVQFTYDYNFGSQMVEGKIDPISKLWNASVATSADLSEKSKAETQLRKGYEATILANHDLKPTSIRTSMKFNAKKSRNNGAS